MSSTTDGKQNPLDPEQVGEASSFTIKELRAKLTKLRLVENIEEHLLQKPRAPGAKKNTPDGSPGT